MQTVVVNLEGAESLPAPFDMFSSFNVLLNGFGTDVAGSAHVIRRRPKVASPQLFFQLREFNK